MTAEQIFNMVKELENGERWKLLNLLYDKYFSKSDVKNSELEYDEINLDFR